MSPTCKNSQKRVKYQKSTDKHSSFDGLIQEDIDLSDIYLAVSLLLKKCPRKFTKNGHENSPKKSPREFTHYVHEKSATQHNL